MKVLHTDIEGVVLIEPEVFGDARGYFFESYSQREFDARVRPVRFVQDNESLSRSTSSGGATRSRSSCAWCGDACSTSPSTSGTGHPPSDATSPRYSPTRTASKCSFRAALPTALPC